MEGTRGHCQRFNEEISLFELVFGELHRRRLSDLSARVVHGHFRNGNLRC
ncbi:MAG: hypothetical protein JO342_05265 [Solirubrobacterales bacterium]|nr:hypothetical protein [Solirubrobacterales bacterium]